MVKADVKRDYYADLDLPPTADIEEIKKQFRKLAKEFHPDRNPGRETEVVPKFQAVQAAHEILIDPAEKAKYDASRARLAAKQAAAANKTAPNADPYNFAPPPDAKPRSTAQPAQASYAFPPPRTKERKAQYPSTNPKQPQASAGAAKFNAFAQSAQSQPRAQTWDRDRFNEEAARTWSHIRPTQTNPQMPPRTPRQHPTMPRPATMSDMPNMPNAPPTSFPGLSKTASSNARKQGFTTAGNADEPAAPRTSAYSYVRGSGGPSPYLYPGEAQNVRSHPTTRGRPDVSPLRHTRSSDYDMRDRVPTSSTGSRHSSKYAGTSGERTEIHTEGLYRSSSVRNSPVGTNWEERGSFGRSPQRYESVPRHRSASPNVRHNGRSAEFSESSSSEDDIPPPQPSERPKAVPRRPKVQTNPSYQNPSYVDSSLTGTFSSKNYTRLVSEDEHYHYPPPPAPEHIRRPFPDMTSPDVETPRSDPWNAARSARTDGPKYVPFPKVSRRRGAPSRCNPFAGDFELSNGLPSWAIPSSVLPPVTPPKQKPTTSHGGDDRSRYHNCRTPSSRPPLYPLSMFDNPFILSLKTNSRNCSSGAAADSSHSTAEAQQQQTHSSKFRSSDWTHQFASDNFIRPNEPPLRRSSPSKTARSGTRTTRGRAMSRGVDQEPTSSSEAVNGHSTTRDQPAEPSTSTAHPPSDADLDSSAQKTNGHNPYPSPTVEDDEVVVEEDAMDVDDPTPQGKTHHAPAANGVSQPESRSRRTSQRKSANGMGGVDLNDLGRQAPFTPSGGGLKGMNDLADTLPTESRPAEKVNLAHKTSTRDRNLKYPKRPKPVLPPSVDSLTKENFADYMLKMGNYVHDWNVFNAKMLEHFQSRQNQFCGAMMQDWISASGDGPDAHELETGDAGSRRAGYAAYLQWIKDDENCRIYWDEANKEHMECIETLGLMRDKAKRLWGR